MGMIKQVNILSSDVAKEMLAALVLIPSHAGYTFVVSVELDEILRDIFRTDPSEIEDLEGMSVEVDDTLEPADFCIKKTIAHTIAEVEVEDSYLEKLVKKYERDHPGEKHRWISDDDRDEFTVDDDKA